MSLKRYLFLLIALFVCLLAGAQIGFISYIKQQMSAEVEDKSRALSVQALELLVKNVLPEQSLTKQPGQDEGFIIRIDEAPNHVVDLDNGFQFVTGENTKIARILRSTKADAYNLHEQLKFNLQQLSISPMKNTYAYSVGLKNDQLVHRQIVQFDKQDSVLEQYFTLLMFATALVCVLGLILAYWLAKHISRPLADLSVGLVKLESGELGSQVNASGIQEVRETLSRFNHMSRRLAELNLLEKRFQQQQQMAELGEVARGLAHTLRNPINTIGLAIEQMSEPDMDDQQRGKLATQVRQKISHLDNTIKSLLSLTATGLNRQQFVEINQLIEDIIMELSMSSKVSIVFTPHPDARIQGAESEIRAMIHTLLVNAVEASATDKTVLVEVLFKEQNLQIKIVDQGGGLSANIKDQLFKPHVTSKPEGAGMGLYIAKRISQFHYHGDVSLVTNSKQSSQPLQQSQLGCTATLTLCMNQPLESSDVE